MIKKTCWYLVVALFFCQCIPVREEKLTEIKMDFNDPVLKRIYDLQYQRNTDSLYLWIRHKNPTYRYAVALAFASVQDKHAMDSLAVLLKDEIDEVRVAAAYALGQLYDEAAATLLIGAFDKDDTLSHSALFNKTILEGVGKCAPPDHLKSLSTVSTYLKTDTLLLEGQALGIYRFALRDAILPEGTQKMIEFAAEPGYPESLRMIAANYLSRAKNLNLDSLAPPLVAAFNQTNDLNTQMALAIALGKTKDPEALNVLLDKFRGNADYRLKCNIIRALGNFNYASVKAPLIDAVKHPNAHIANAAAQFFVDHGYEGNAEQYWVMAKDTSLNWQVQTTLYRAANKHIPYYLEATLGRINQELRNRFQKAANVYEKGATLMALSEFGWNYRFIKDQGFSSTDPVVRAAGAEAIAAIAKYPRFAQFFGLGQRRVKRELGAYFVEAIKSGDPALAGIAANVISDPQLDFKSAIDSVGFLEEGLAKLTLPKHIETYMALQKAISYFNGNSDAVANPDLEHNPVDWHVVETLDGGKAVVQTNKGNIVLEFLTQQTPGSVGNFVQLAKNGFFDGKRFHRVVPNFVIQTGCTRGDGWGILDYVIPTETPMTYFDSEGLVGMASSGKDTESTQWFITHSPAMHLDGKYTLFAKVVEGMEVVHKITLGDEIIKITITK